MAIGYANFRVWIWAARHLHPLLAAPVIIAALFATAFLLALADQIEPEAPVFKREKQPRSD